MARSFEELLVWQKAHALMLYVHQQVVPLLPPSEKWDLAIQIRKSSKSTPSNIAEGHGRFSYGDTIRFCYNARGSLSETENHLIAARDLQYIPSPVYDHARTLTGEVHRILNGYVVYLKHHKPGRAEPGHDINPNDHSPSDREPPQSDH